MPRRTSMPDNQGIPSPPPSISNISLLRQQWKWAAFSQFFYTFSPLFATMNDVSLNDIESDLVHATNEVLPRIMHRLLYTLSYDRKVSLDNWQTALRKQYNKRDPQANPLGPEPKLEAFSNQEEDGFQLVEEEVPFQVVDTLASSPRSPPHMSHSDDRSVKTALHQQLSDRNNADMSEKDISIDWFQLPMLSKLESMHTLIEWQFQHPMRLRNIMKCDDELALWRMEPIGYDSKKNAYWFIGNRLWIQRTPPKPSKPLKRKRIPQTIPSAKRPKLTVSITQLPNKKISHTIHPQHSTRHSRAAKDQAIIKLDAQAKDLANLNRQAALLSHESKPTGHSSRPLGTRISARLRGTQQEEWQPVPKEWLNEEENLQNGRPEAELSKTGLESDDDDISDLTELSEEVSDDSKRNSPRLDRSLTVEHEESGELQVLDNTPTEWETICTTLEEWEHIIVRFEKATHYSEKALHKVLSHDIVPIATQELREIEQKHRLEDALIHRKRSSRIASKESEREEARLAAKKKQEEVEKLTRSRRMEARLQKEEAGRLKREHAREQRRKERETREQSKKAATPTPERQFEDAGSSSNHHSIDYHKIEGEHGLSRSSTHTPAGDWELCCEVCHRQGVNIDDGTPMMSCALCFKWQHILCHNKRDQAAGHPLRNWDSVEFICQRCRAYQLEGSDTPNILTNTQEAPQNLDTPQLAVSYTIPETLQRSGSFVRGLQGASFRGSSDRRPNGARQSSGTQRHFSSSTSNAYDSPSLSTPQQIISFSHYQPEHGFSSSAQRAQRPDSAYPAHPLYETLGLNEAISYKPQIPIPEWNVAAQARNLEHPATQNGHTEVTNLSQCTHPPNENLRFHQFNDSSSSVSATVTYPSHQHYPISQFKHHPASPSRR